jgi:sigma-B regulation protein RsbQ
MQSILKRHNVTVRGHGPRTIMFSHGFGCDQQMWRDVAPAFEDDFTVLLFDSMGAGASDASGYDAGQYGTLQRYADDVLAICEALDVREAVFVGHSVAAMIGMLAAIGEPARFARLVMVAPSPCYINSGDYVGGFERGDVDDLLDFIDDNYVAWAMALAPVIMGPEAGAALGRELERSFCRTDPTIARQFARVTFLSDHRDDLAKLRVPALILQCSRDTLAPAVVGRYLAAALHDSTLVQLAASGHCPHLSAPAETVAAIRAYLD